MNPEDNWNPRIFEDKVDIAAWNKNQRGSTKSAIGRYDLKAFERSKRSKIKDTN